MLNTKQISHLAGLEQVINHHPLTFTPDTLVVDAIAYFNQTQESCQECCCFHGERISCVLVVAEQKLVGIFTEHDVAKIVLTGMNLSGLKISEVMTQPVVTLNPHQAQDIHAVLSIVRQHRVCHLPVVGASGEVLGLIALSTANRVLQQQMSEQLRQARSQLELSTQELAKTKALLQQEINERKGSEKLYRSVITVMQEGIVLQNADGSIIDCNNSAEEILGLTRDQIAGRTSYDPRWRAIHENGEPFSGENHPAIVTLRTGESCSGVIMGVHKPNGELRWISINSQPLFKNNQMLPYAVIVSFSDITERKIAEESLRQSSERFRLAVTASKTGIWDWDIQANKLTWSNNIESFFGVPTNFFGETYESFINCVHLDDRQRVTKAIAVSRHDKIEHQIEFRIVLPDGSIRWLAGSGKAFDDGKGVAVRLAGTVVDITTRKQTEEKNQEQAALLDVTTDAILVRGLNRKILYWNKGAERLYGWKKEEILNQNANKLLYKQMTPELETALFKVVEDGFWQGELHKISKEGKEITVASRWALMRDSAGRPKSILAVDTDITEKKQLEAQFLRNQRLDSLGTLASGIAHDLNNLLTPILVAGQLLASKITNLDSQDQHTLQMLENNAQRAADLVKQILSFARGTSGNPILVKVKHLLLDIEQIAKSTFDKSIEIEIDIAENIGTVYADVTQLHQVFMNLILNARDAMPNGGTLSITAKHLSVDETYTKMNIEAKVGDYVMVTVADTGIGISESIVDRIFDPFFTTKEVGKGTGLGLSTVIGIIRNYGGFVEVSSSPGNGSTFKVYLPTDSEANQTISKCEQKSLLGNGELILVVDDEASVVSVAKATLENNNYKVLTAKDGISAIVLYAQHKGEISLVLTDMMMPSMNGVTTIRTLQKMNPQVQILAMSGLATKDAIASAIDTGIQGFLSKPFTAQELLQTLKAALNKS